MKSRSIIKRVISRTTFSDDKYYAYAPKGEAMEGYRLVRNGNLIDGDYFFSNDSMMNGKTVWVKALGVVDSSIASTGGKACRLMTAPIQPDETNHLTIPENQVKF
jgi:hypothetical protein